MKTQRAALAGLALLGAAAAANALPVTFELEGLFTRANSGVLLDGPIEFHGSYSFDGTSLTMCATCSPATPVPAPAPLFLLLIGVPMLAFGLLRHYGVAGGRPAAT